jgi:hypothetical protein
MHSARVSGPSSGLFNAPVPPGSSAKALLLEEPNEYAVRCAAHDDERAVLVVVDHPYAVVVGDDGSFVLDNVPAGSLRLLVLSPDGDKLRRSEQSVDLTAGAERRVRVDIDAGAALATNKEHTKT